VCLTEATKQILNEDMSFFSQFDLKEHIDLEVTIEGEQRSMYTYFVDQIGSETDPNSSN